MMMTFKFPSQGSSPLHVGNRHFLHFKKITLAFKPSDAWKERGGGGSVVLGGWMDESSF